MSNVSVFAITPSDSANLTFPCRAIWVGVTGDIALIVNGDDTSTVFKAVPAGWFTPPHGAGQKIIKVLATGTTATNLVGSVGLMGP